MDLTGLWHHNLTRIEGGKDVPGDLTGLWHHIFPCIQTIARNGSSSSMQAGGGARLGKGVWRRFGSNGSSGGTRAAVGWGWGVVTWLG